MSAAVEVEQVPTTESVSSGLLLGRARTRRISAASAAFSRRVLLGLARRGAPLRVEVREGATVFRCVDEPRARLDVHDARAYTAVLRAGSVGLGSSYVAGWWDSDDLTAMMDELFKKSASSRNRLDAIANNRLVRGPRDLLTRTGAPGRARDRRNVQAHYDLSNRFFELLLDKTMSYSCALFEDPHATLSEAQLARIDKICRKLELRPSDHLLEIGCGWGQFALQAAARYGCHVTTTTISNEQHRFVVERVKTQGLSDKITVLQSDWRDLTGRYDKLASIEMIEAVDWRRHDEYWTACSDRLVDDGVALVQEIVIDDRSFERAKHHPDLIKALVFPGSCIPSLSSTVRSIARTPDLRVVDVEDIGRHYAETLHRWAVNLESHRVELDELGVEPALHRLFRLYLAYCEAAFLERHISDVQLLVAKPSWRGKLAKRPT